MKIGIFGGSFDPLHSEHIRLINKSLEYLDKVILVPTYNPPHKNKNQTTFDKRLEMLMLYAKDKENIYIDTIENELKLDDSFSYIVIPKLKVKYPDDTLYYIIGADSAINFHKWKNPELIANEVRFLVYGRKPFTQLDKAIRLMKEDYSADVTLVGFQGEDVSSSELRSKIMLGLDCSDYLEPNIYKFIIENDLYSQYKDIVSKLKKSVSSELFQHSARTVLYGIKRCAKLNLPYEQVFLACLLHDAAKELKPLKDYKDVPLKIIHQYDGRIIAKLEYGIKDKEILDAIEYHTTGKPNMSMLQKLVYAADKLEDARDFEGINEIRREIDASFDLGFLLLLKRNTEYLMSKNVAVDDLTNRTYLYYNKTITNGSDFGAD